MCFNSGSYVIALQNNTTRMFAFESAVIRKYRNLLVSRNGLARLQNSLNLPSLPVGLKKVMP